MLTSIRQRLPLGDRLGGSPLPAELTAQQREITHEALDALPRTSPTRHLPVTRIADLTSAKLSQSASQPNGTRRKDVTCIQTDGNSLIPIPMTSGLLPISAQ